MRGESDTAGEQGSSPAPLLRSGGGSAVRNHGSGWWTYECVNRVPHGVEIRNFVDEKFEDVERDSNAEDDRVSHDFKRRRKVNHAESLQDAESGYGCVKIETRGKTGSQSEAERLERVHKL